MYTVCPRCLAAVVGVCATENTLKSFTEQRLLLVLLWQTIKLVKQKKSSKNIIKKAKSDWSELIYSICLISQLIEADNLLSDI